MSKKSDPIPPPNAEKDVFNNLRKSDRWPYGILNSDLNMYTILTMDSRMKGKLRFNDLNCRIYYKEKQLTDEMITRISIWVERNYRFTTSKIRVDDGVRVVASLNAFNPLQDYLKSLKWDGVERTPTFLRTYFRADDTELNKAISKRWLISCVARAIEPGCKVDTCLIFVGKQGLLKSTGFRALCQDPSWFSDTKIDLRSKDAYQQLDGVWIYEAAELDSFSRRDASSIKAFLSSSEDNYRRPFARTVTSNKRMTAIVGTTNKDAFLNDPTGSRRFWPVRVYEIDIDGITENRDQIWAETMQLYASGEQWWLTKDETALLQKESRKYDLSDSWEDAILPWISNCSEDTLEKGLTTTEIFEGALGMKEAREMTATAQHRLAQVMRSIGFERTRTRRGGQQIRVWRKANE